MSDKYQLYKGDCLDFMRGMDAGSVDAVITDPPYGDINHIDRLHERAKGKGGPIRKLHKGRADEVNFDWLEMLELLNSVVSQWVYIFAGDNTGAIRSFFNGKDCMTRLGVWQKTNPTPLHAQYIWLSSLEPCAIARKHKGTFNRFYSQPVWNYPSGESDLHPTQKPVSLMSEIIQSSTNKDDIVFDPFMGSGTTGVACMQLGRKFIGCELDPAYFAIAEKRIKAAASQEIMF